ncbi:MAG: ABC transporter ATP-binding protein [Desulfobacterium sp.]|nr:ABC transporter ATP-binding protein [Desulfobacterium sp.]
MEMSIRNLSFSYDKVPVLQGVDLDFKRGRFYSILGPNGCGKTTLLDLLIRHRTPDTGTITLDTRALGRLSRKEIAQTISLVSQNYNINFPFTVKEVVMMGRHPYISRFSTPGAEDIRIVDQVMERTGINGFRNRRITELSGGERQRCVVARALCQDTPLLFLDEAFSSMDISHTLRLLAMVKKEVARSNKIVVSVFHDINLASAWSDSLVFMKGGRVAAAGDTREVLTEAVLGEVFEVASKVAFNEYAGAKQAYFKAEGHG